MDGESLPNSPDIVFTENTGIRNASFIRLITQHDKQVIFSLVGVGNIVSCLIGFRVAGIGKLG